MAHSDELKPGTNPAAVATTQRQEETCREAGNEELSERGSPVEVQQTLHQEEAGREAGAEELPEQGSPVEVQRTLHQEGTGKVAGAENLPERGTLRSLKTDAGREMKRPIIVVVVEDKGDEDDPHHATEDRAGHPVPGHQRWDPGKWHSGLRENEELRPGRNSPSFEAATGRRTNRGSVSPG